MKREQKNSLGVPISDFHAGDRVQVIDREATPDENRQRVFFNHMRGLIGVVRRVYPEEGEVWVDVDRDSLPEAIRRRHEETEGQIHSRWFDALSDEARRRLDERQSKFSLRYSILTSPNHLIVLEKSPKPDEPKREVRSKQAAAEEVANETEDPMMAASRRRTSRDLNAAEREFLKRARSGKGRGD